MVNNNEQNNSGKVFKSFSKQLKGITKKAGEFLNPTAATVKEVENFLKEVYSFTTKVDDIVKKNSEILPELYLESLDTEAVWQQIDIRNNFEIPIILESVSSALAIPDASLNFEIQTHSDSDEIPSNDENFDDDENQEIVENNGAKNKIKPAKKKKKKVKPSIVDDKFFKLNELDAFLTQEDKKEMLKTSKGFNERLDDGINYFSEELGIEEDVESDEANVNYKDFFDAASGSEDFERENLEGEEEVDVGLSGKDSENGEEASQDDEDLEQESEEGYFNGEVTSNDKEKYDENEDNADVEDDSENENEISDENIKSGNDGPKSSFQLRQERLQERITELEGQALGDKPWQLKGEIKAQSRPQNSLLEEVLEFDAGTRPAPIITQETNLRLEDIIRQRIKDQAWDDPERKVKPVNTPQDFRKKLILDGEKSKESLAQIYEKEYQKQLEKLNIGDEANEIEEEPKEHKEIKAMMNDLFTKLDALSNFHFTPKPAQAEPKIITNTPAINIEEVAPVAVSNAQLLAPEEVKSSSKGDILGKSERSKTDKNRERRHKRNLQKRVFKEKEERELQKQKAGIPLTKKEDKDKALRNVIKNRNVSKMSESTDNIKSSKSFFNQLQGDTAVGVKVKRKASNKFSDGKPNLSAKKLKL